MRIWWTPSLIYCGENGVGTVYASIPIGINVWNARAFNTWRIMNNELSVSDHTFHTTWKRSWKVERYNISCLCTFVIGSLWINFTDSKVQILCMIFCSIHAPTSVLSKSGLWGILTFFYINVFSLTAQKLFSLPRVFWADFLLQTFMGKKMTLEFWRTGL